MFTLTIKKEVQLRNCKIVENGDGSLGVFCYADSVAYIQDFRDPVYGTLDVARNYCETVQLGGAVHWARQGNAWVSDSVLCFNGGERLNPAECELARKQLARHGALKPSKNYVNLPDGGIAWAPDLERP